MAILAPKRSYTLGNTSGRGLPAYSVASKNSTFGLPAAASQARLTPQNLPFSLGWPSTTMALICITATARAHEVPALDSLMPPVSGDLPPTETRADVGAAVPVNMPGEKTSLLLGPSGWHSGGTSSA